MITTEILIILGDYSRNKIGKMFAFVFSISMIFQSEWM